VLSRHSEDLVVDGYCLQTRVLSHKIKTNRQLTTVRLVRETAKTTALARSFEAVKLLVREAIGSLR
jgi:hypothetical protein